MKRKSGPGRHDRGATARLSDSPDGRQARLRVRLGARAYGVIDWATLLGHIAWARGVVIAAANIGSAVLSCFMHGKTCPARQVRRYLVLALNSRYLTACGAGSRHSGPGRLAVGCYRQQRTCIRRTSGRECSLPRR